MRYIGCLIFSDKIITYKKFYESFKTNFDLSFSIFEAVKKFAPHCKIYFAGSSEMFGNPKILVLDEPNANLDTEGELALSHALNQAKEAGCSVVVISHRPSLLSMVDNIAVLREGIIVKYGIRDEVLAELSQPISGQAGKSPANTQ